MYSLLRIKNRQVLIGALLALALECRADVIDYWRLEEGTGSFAVDQTGLANGTLQGFPDTSAGAGDTSDLGWSTNVPSATVPQTGSQDQNSLHFAQYGGAISLSPSSGLNCGTNFTVEFSFNLDTLPTHDSPYSFLQFSDGNALLSLAIGHQNFQPLLIQFGGADADGGGSGFYSSGALSLSAATWYHFAFVKNGDNYTFFVDGLSVGSGILNAPQNGAYNFATNGSFLIGASFRGLDGYLDEVRISNTALDPSQFLNAIPEPSTFGLTVGALVWLAALRKRRTRCTRRTA